MQTSLTIKFKRICLRETTGYNQNRDNVNFEEPRFCNLFKSRDGAMVSKALLESCRIVAARWLASVPFQNSVEPPVFVTTASTGRFRPRGRKLNLNVTIDAKRNSRWLLYFWTDPSTWRRLNYLFSSACDQMWVNGVIIQLRSYGSL